MTRKLIILWGLFGVVGVLLQAISRLAPRSIEALSMDLAPLHWGFALVWVLFMLYSEAYRGFYLRFSPTVVARAWHLGAHPRPLHVVLAPLFCMGFFHASRRRLLTSWILTAAIVAMVMAIRLVPQPWRGLVDLGVVMGLLAGAGTILWLALGVARGAAPADAQLPDPSR